MSSTFVSSEGLISLDTNVLLNLYRLPKIARDEFFSVLDSVQDRLWIPHHVGVEFQRRRIGVIVEAREKADSALRKAREHLNATQEKVRSLELDKAGLDLDPENLLADLERTSGQLMSAIQMMHDSLVDVSASDPIRARLDELLAGRVGAGPTMQEDLASLLADAEHRYENQIPPGFKDIGKDKDPRQSVFLSGGITYESKYGDLVIWKQLLAQARLTGAVGVLFVTSDQKDDWWWIDHGRTLGPHPELVSEMQNEADIALFWMYSAKSFADLAGRYTTVEVSARSLGDIDAVEHLERSREPISKRPESERVAFRARRNHAMALSALAENAVVDWVSQQGHEVYLPDRPSFADLLVNTRSSRHPVGVVVKLISQPERALGRRFDDVLARGYVEVSEGRLDGWGLILVVAPDSDPTRQFRDGEALHRTSIQIERMLERADGQMSRHMVNVLLGVLDDGEFVPVHSWGESLL